MYVYSCRLHHQLVSALYDQVWPDAPFSTTQSSGIWRDEPVHACFGGHVTGLAFEGLTLVQAPAGAQILSAYIRCFSFTTFSIAKSGLGLGLIAFKKM